MAKPSWTPWHEVVSLRDDLKTGDLSLQMFAADLYEAIMRRGKQPVYESPESFFALTFPTHNLRNLVRDVAMRLAGKNDKAVRQLELTYGGGKTHTLITLYHLVNDPDNLPDLPAVREFEQAIGQKPPKARVAGLCFDKLDVEKGTEVRSPEGKTRRLKQPWSVLAYQIAGDEGLEVLHADGKAQERDTVPAENTLMELLELPGREGLGVLVLMDEVLMYAREKVRTDRGFGDALNNFFQGLTQAATKVKGCCIVASLLATDPKKSDDLGRQLLGDFYDIFRREKEEGVEPVVKEDVAEVLRRRFFTPKSIENREMFRQHVIAALKGIQTVDEQTAKAGSAAEERFLKSYPFHPDMTEVLYTKWTQMHGFQRTRGVLRTFALALREAANWDQSPLIGPTALLNAPDKEDLSEAMRELVTIADTEEHEGRKTAWTGILVGELSRARELEKDSVGLKFRELEQAVVTTFLNSQPVGQSARTRDLTVMISTARPDKIELEKGLTRWAQVSHWLDDAFTTVDEGQLPATWRLGNRPNLNQMHALASKHVSDEIVRARLFDEIPRAKKMTAGASAAGVAVHTLPARPSDVKDDGTFRFAVLGPSAACDSGKPSPEARKYLDENTGPDNPRVYRNAVILLCPSRDGIDVAEARIRDYLAWDTVRDEIKKQEQEGSVDAARMQTLVINLEKTKGRVPEAIRQAYSTVVTVSEKNEIQAFKITVSEDPHFTTIKGDKRARIQDTAITAEALLPGGPYDLWKEGDTSRRVKDLAGAFAQLPHLPKMLKAEAIVDTLVGGCEQGSFVLRVTRPDGSFRTWWRVRPDETALQDAALELALPDSAELAEIAPPLLAPHKLPELWPADEIVVQDVIGYFSGGKIVQVDRGGYKEPVPVPKASPEVVEKAVAGAVESGALWLLSGPASILGESIPAGILTPAARLCVPPAMIPAAEMLPENLPDAWQDDETNALAIATALSQKVGKTLPWRTVRDVISASLQARFVELADGTGIWPCEIHAAKAVKLKVAASGGSDGGSGAGCGVSKLLAADAELEPSQIQDLADAVPRLLEIKAKANLPIRFRIRVEVGDGEETPPPEVAEQINKLLDDVAKGFRLE
ncbi:MAG: ATP-binding protein [Pirellulales bacterium]|nr:ATP-binding protein [Pirellulales bacterium]